MASPASGRFAIPLVSFPEEAGLGDDPAPSRGGSPRRRGWGRWGGGSVAAAAILDSAVALAAVRRRVWGVALPSPSPRFLGGGSSHWGGCGGGGIYSYGGDYC